MTDRSIAWADDPPRPHASIQYKGANLCADFYCDCGDQFHIDGYFAYMVRCKACGTVYALDLNVKLHKIDEYDDKDVMEDEDQFNPEWTKE